MSFRWRAAGLVAAAALAAGCVTFRKPAISFEGVAVSDLGRDGASLDVELGVTNPNGYRLGVR
ncbi:MAG TPA: hypothetical protein VG777_04955, partial [Thermoanaerobaculia bacterium]|nr:hypothetical protein [Thermoanaerobaculia bacterium]